MPRLPYSTRFNNVTMSKLDITPVSVVQSTSITSGVTCNGDAGLITLFTSGTLATSGNSSFVVTNSAVSSTSVVLANIVEHSSTGIPVLNVNNVASGSFELSLYNAHPTQAITLDSIKVGFFSL